MQWCGQAARAATPDTMAAEVRRRGVKRQAKERKSSEATELREEKKQQAKLEARQITWAVETWVDGQLVGHSTEYEMREGPDEDDLDDDFDDERVR